MHARSCAARSLALLATLLVAACASNPSGPQETTISEKVEGEALVLAVDRPARALTLQRHDGSRVVVAAGPEVRNFDRIEAGQKVRATCSMSLTVRRLDPNEPDTNPEMGMAASRAALGAAPAGALGVGVAWTVRIKSVDLKQNTVVYTDPDGTLHAAQAEREEGKKFIAGLKPGDRVEMLYSEAVILSVE